MSLTLTLIADDAADIAALVNSAMGHERAQHDIVIDDRTGAVGVTVTVPAAPPDPLELLCDLAYDTPEDADAIGCQLLDGHDGVHYHPDVGEFDDDGHPTATPAATPIPPGCFHQADCQDIVECDRFAGHDGPHTAHGLRWDSDGSFITDAGGTDSATSDEGAEPEAAEPELLDDPEPDEQPTPDDSDEPEPVEDLAEPGGASPPLTCADAIVALVETDRTIAWSIADIVDGIEGGYKPATVSFTLGELYKEHRILRAGRGLYQAA